ncbi:MAG: hypothetical protein KBD76_11755 [Bacteriovorax sp.]|nr:hypothetical protein [Bacteriovorax sp.]
MKTHLLIPCFVLAISAFSVFAEEDSQFESKHELFSREQRQIILETIDKTCGDSWCEGDYDFQFNDFSCSQKTFICELSFQFIKRDEESESASFSQPQFCHFKKIHGLNQIMNSEYMLETHFYESLSLCISKKESQINL